MSGFYIPYAHKPGMKMENVSEMMLKISYFILNCLLFFLFFFCCCCRFYGLGRRVVSNFDTIFTCLTLGFDKIHFSLISALVQNEVILSSE